ncbi:MAG: sugar-binding protein [Sulfurihydrogenibium sp.]|uniref:sugar-binding protein n=1 Tax=Sulfurihydrogenibium sp. TaxID=2053621 RepID=UPI003C7ED62C
MVLLRVFLILLIFTFNFANAAVFVKPSEITYLEVNYNGTIVAGESQTIEFKATDTYGNPSNNTGLSDKIKIVSNGLMLDKNEIYPVDIKNGKFTLKVTGRKAGNYSIQFLINDKPILIKVYPTNALTSSLQFKVINNKADFIVITSPDRFLPGYPYKVNISFYDKEGNPVVTKYHINQSFTIVANGTSKDIDLKDFSGETYQYEITPYTVKEFNIEVIDKSTNKKVASKTIQPEIQEIGKIEIETPNDIEVGKPFKLVLKAFDKNGRLIKVYDKIGKDVILKTTGTGELIPNKVPKEAFSDGIAQVDVIYTKSEEIKIEPVLSQEEKSSEENLKQTKMSMLKSEDKEVKQNKEKTSIKLKFPIELGDLSRIVETTKSENSVSLKAIFSKRDLDYEVKKYEKDISINSKNIGKLVFYEEPDHNVRIVLYLDTNKYNVNYKLTEKNSVEVEVEEK